MKKFRVTVTLMILLGSNVMIARAQTELKDPVEILKKADAACKENKAVSYEASFKGLGVDENRAPTATGTVILSGTKNQEPAKFRVTAKIQKPGSSDILEITATSDEDKFALLDVQAKKVYEDIDSQVFGSYRNGIRALTMRELILAEAYADEIKGEKQELKEPAKIKDEDCYQVYVKYGPNQEANWFFSKKDFLPRKVERNFTNRSGEKGGSELTIFNLNTAPKMDASTFKLIVPEGFTKTDDFAP